MKKGQPQQNPQVAKVSIDDEDFLLSLVIPCYNESKRVDLMLAGLAAFEEKWGRRYEVIIVDDGSKDDTVRKIQETVQSTYSFLESKIRIEQLSKNKGKGGALKQGVSVANGDYILTLDADMSTKPVELLNWQKKEKNIFSTEDTIYVGSRRHEEGKVEALASRRMIGGVFNGIVQVLTSLHLKDTQCGFKLYPRNVAKFLFESMQSTGWAHDVELLYQADLNDINIVEMPINWVNQPESKVHVVRDSVMMFLGVLSISLRIWLYNSFVLPFRIPKTANTVQRKHIVYRGVFNIMSVVLIIGMPLMSFQFGITGDEHWHFDYGNSIYNYFFHGDTSAQTATSGIQYYGGLFDFITAYVYNVFHIWDHYSTMHFINALVGAIGIIYAGKLAKLLGHWNTGILAMGLLVFSPSWFGHNFANPKDIPFSVGYTAGIYYMLLYLRALPRPSLKHIFGLIASIGWAMGVRIGGLLLIAYLIFFIAAFAMVTGQVKKVINFKVVRQVILVAVSGYLIAIICWPYAHLGLITKPLEALKIMSNFFINIGMIYDGQRMLSNQVPWYYIPRYILYTAPIVVLVGSVLGLLFIPFEARNRKNILLFAMFVLFAIIFPWLYAVYKKSTLYDGWRHFLFIYPPIVVFAAIGWTFLMDRKQRVIRYAAILLVAGGLFSPIAFAIRNHPFESLYYNEVAGGLKGIYGKYETDYYMLGMQPAYDWLIKNEHLGDKKVIIGTTCTFPVVAYNYLSHYRNLPWKYDRIYERYADFRHDSLYDVYSKTYPDFKDNFPISIDYVKYYYRYEKDWDYCILFSRFVEVSQISTGNWPPPETIHTIDVDGVPIAAIMKRKTKKDYLGFRLVKERKIDSAKAIFYEALQDYPKNDLVWEALSKIYDDEDKYDSVLYTGRKALQTYPSDIDVFQYMGRAYLKKHMVDSAITLYNSLAKYHEGYSHFFLAYAYATIGNASRAFSELDQAIEIDPYGEQSYKLGITIARQIKDTRKEQEYREKAAEIFNVDDDDDNSN